MASKLGFIGLGIMGKPVARNLMGAGHELVVHNRRPEPAEELAAEGATAASSRHEMTEQSDVVITMLPDCPQSAGAAGQELGQVHGAGAQPAPAKPLLELAQAPGVDRHDQVEVGVGDLVELAVEHRPRVLGTQDRVGAGSAAAVRGTRQLDVLAHLGDERSGLAVDAEPVAEVAGVLQAYAQRPLPAPATGGWSAPAAVLRGGAHHRVLRARAVGDGLRG